MSPLDNLPKSRIARYCVCCASTDLESSPAILMPFVAHRVFDWAPIVVDESWGLRTIERGHAYSICKSLRCNYCGHLFLDIRFADDELARLYDDYRGESYVTLRERYEPGYSCRNEKLNAGISHSDDIESFLSQYLVSPVRILDWGGDTGKNTPYRDNNIALHVFDISNKAVVPGAKAVTRAEVSQNEYDLIVCSHVLEHVPYPSDLLRQIRAVMLPTTVLYLELPLEYVVRHYPQDSLRHKKHWHEHINFFTEASLSNLVDKSGMTLIDLKTLNVGTEDAPVYVFQVACRLAQRALSVGSVE